MRKRFKVVGLISILFLFSVDFIFAQDTIRVMQYNLLYYGKKTDFCTTTNNNIDDKNGYLKEIIQYVKPDIFSVNELDGEGAYPVSDDATYLLENALNVDGISYYRRTEFPVIYLANTIFYNSNKLRIKEHIPKSFYYAGLEKVFNVYKFYYNAEDLETTNDTAYIYCLVAHLKAGSYPENETQRAYETSVIMDYFESIGEEGNYLVMGDFNLYTPTETAFQNLINPENNIYSFYDPADQIGEWSSNYDYRYYHTQSTHSSGDCYSGGGMDDRFDFILASNYIMNGNNHFQYITDSYKTIGQDGSSYNSSLNTSSNSVVPANVAQALYKMSDHLPVYLELKIDQNQGEPLGLVDDVKEEVSVIYQNPVKDNLLLQATGITSKEVIVSLYSVQGEKLIEKEVTTNNRHLEISFNLTKFPDGIYVLNISNKNELVYSSKILIQN